MQAVLISDFRLRISSSLSPCIRLPQRARGGEGVPNCRGSNGNFRRAEGGAVRFRENNHTRCRRTCASATSVFSPPVRGGRGPTP